MQFVTVQGVIESVEVKIIHKCIDESRFPYARLTKYKDVQAVALI